MKKPAPRTKEREVRTAEIQAAAKEVFFKKGYQNTTIREIAKKAKISVGTVYLYYKGKEDLYVSLVIPSLEELGRLLSAFEKDLETGKYKDRDIIMDFYRAYRGYYEYDPDGVRIFQAFQLGNLFSVLSRQSLSQLDKVGRQNLALCRRILSKGVELGLLPEIDVIKWTDIIWGLFLGIVQIEENKLRWTEKDHIQDTMVYAFEYVSDAVNKKMLMSREKMDSKSF